MGMANPDLFSCFGGSESQVESTISHYLRESAQLPDLSSNDRPGSAKCFPHSSVPRRARGHAPVVRGHEAVPALPASMR